MCTLPVAVKFVLVLALYGFTAFTAYAVGQNNKLKVLAIHGFASSAAIFHMQMAHITQACADFADFTFANGPTLIPEASTKKRPRFTWWSRQDTKQSTEYLGMHEGLTALTDLQHSQDDDDRPFDVIIGHSQGAAMAVLIALLNASRNSGQGTERNVRVPSQPSMFLFYSGFPPLDDALVPLYTELSRDDINVESHWIIGANDNVVFPEYSEAAMEMFRGAKKMIHIGSHDPPRCEESTAYVTHAIKTLAEKIKEESRKG